MTEPHLQPQSEPGRLRTRKRRRLCPRVEETERGVRYIYTDTRGSPVHATFRGRGKRFWQERYAPNGKARWVKGLGKVERHIYGRPELRKAARRGAKTAYIVEGEKDALALWRRKKPATCNPMGAGKWRDAFTEQVAAAGFDRIMVWCDWDEAGKRHGALVLDSFRRIAPSLKVRVVRSANDLNDASDHLEAGFLLKDVVPVGEDELAAVSGRQEKGPGATDDDGPISQGERNERLASEGGKLRRLGHTGEPLVQMLLAVNTERCSPPLPEAEVRRVARSISSYPGNLFDEQGKPNTALLASLVKQRLGLLRGSDRRLYCYDQSLGVYRGDGEDLAADLTKQILGQHFKKYHLAEVLEWNLRGSPEMPAAGHQDPEVLNVANGLLHWRTGELRPHSPEFVTTVQLPVPWRVEATCPGVERFVRSIVPEDAVELVWEVIGYALMWGNPLHKAVLFLGVGRNGKSTLLRVIEALLGERNFASVPLQALSENRFAAARLYGRLANVCGDLDARVLKQSDLFKQLTGGDVIETEQKFKARFSFTWQGVAIFASNEPPLAYDQSDAYAARWLIVPFPRRFSEAEADPELLGKLTRPAELEGALRRGVEALGRLMARGRFEVPPSVREQGEAFRQRLDSVLGFLTARCTLAVGDPKARIPKVEVHDAYFRWCERERRRPVDSGQRFAERVRALAPELGEVKVRGERMWRGLRWNDGHGVFRPPPKPTLRLKRKRSGAGGAKGATLIPPLRRRND